jgi:hypothetical protein
MEFGPGAGDPSDEYPAPAQPVAHPANRLAFLEEARPPVVVPAGPADRPLAGAHSFDELEAVERSLSEYLVVGHPPRVPRRCGARRVCKSVGFRVAGTGRCKVGTAKVRYHFLCPTHGRIGSAQIDERMPPRPRPCPVCADTSEVWVGTTLNHVDRTRSGIDTPMLRAG